MSVSFSLFVLIAGENLFHHVCDVFRRSPNLVIPVLDASERDAEAAG